MRTRRLALRRETLTALATDDLALVAGAAEAHTLPGCLVDDVKNVTSYLVSCSIVRGWPSSPSTKLHAPRDAPSHTE
jgi:hypothetical protein